MRAGYVRLLTELDVCLAPKRQDGANSSLLHTRQTNPAYGGHAEGPACLDHIQPPSTIHICAVQERLSSAASQRTMRATSAG